MLRGRNTIRSVTVADLFGQYTYIMPVHGSFSDAVILYGDNGVGKSTILKLVFHLLSAADNRGHRTGLADVPYRSLEVSLNSGIVLRAERINEPITSHKIRLTIVDEHKQMAEWNYDSDNPRGATDATKFNLILDRKGRSFETKSLNVAASSSNANQHAAYIAALAAISPTIFYLSADRRLEADSISEQSDEVESRFIWHIDETRKVDDVIAKSREAALTSALSKCVRWIQQKAFLSANQGSTNTHSVYTNVVRHIATAQTDIPVEKTSADSKALRKRLTEIADTTAALVKYELAIPVDVQEFRRSLAVGPVSKRELVAGVLSPYVEGLEGRLNALLPLFEVVNRFVTTLNGFFTNKKVSFTLSKGFSILNSIGDNLEPGMLSSGEQQLLLLFCNTLTARDSPSVFIIDEPEISLNVKWQGILIQSLLHVTDGAPIQFVFASHSIEMISQHSKRVVHLSQGR